VWLLAGNVFSLKYDPAFGRPEETGNQIKKCGFASTVGTDDTDHFAFFDVYIDVRDRSQSAKMFSQLESFKKHARSPTNYFSFLTKDLI
jgi:hypothetical protein